jgi:hypothetical protein
LSDNGAPHMGKRAIQCAVAFSSATFTTVNLMVDSENGSKPFSFTTGIPITWVNNLNQVVQFQNNSLQNVNWFSTGFIYQRSPAAGTGVYLGLGITATVAGSTAGVGGFVINMLVLEYQDNKVMGSRMSA